MRIITGAPAFFESSAGIMQCTEPVARLPKPPPVYSVISTTSLGSSRRDRLHRALRAGVHVKFAVLPVRHRRARLEHVMLVVGDRERLVEHQGRVLEAGLDVAVRPFHLGLAHRHLALVVLGEVLRGPLQRLDLKRSWRLPLRGRWTAPDVAFLARVGTIGPQARDRIHDERQRLEVHDDGFDRGRGRLFVNRGHGQHRLAGVDRFVGERFLALGVGANGLAEVRHRIRGSR
jgi:hypothetical protein